MYIFERRTVSALTRELFWCLFPELRSNHGNKHQNNTPVRAETVHHECIYIILFLTWQHESINDDKNEDLHASSRVSLAQFSFCWWRHNRLLMTSQWLDNCDAITWIMICNSLDIDFIHGDIRGRSCKNCKYPHFCCTDWRDCDHNNLWCWIPEHILSNATIFFMFQIKYMTYASTLDIIHVNCHSIR